MEKMSENLSSASEMNTSEMTAFGVTPDVNGIEEAFERLNEILAKMDGDEVSLEESFRLYEQGMKLIKYCNETIDTVEKKVRVLSAEGGTDEF